VAKATCGWRRRCTGGHLITLESEPPPAAVALSSLNRAVAADFVELHVDLALETSPHSAYDSRGPLDFIFIDVQKRSYPGYFT